jgi:hypothetical protein
MPSLRQSSLVIGVLLIAGIGTLTLYFGKPKTVGFLETDKVEIQGIANRICAAARQNDCTVVWGGKHKWFGTLQPISTEQALAGLDHVRAALGSQAWQASTRDNGTQFTDGRYEVSVSKVSGAITITSSAPSK